MNAISSQTENSLIYCVFPNKIVGSEYFSAEVETVFS